MKKKTSLLVICLVFLMGLMVGCAGNGASDSNQTSSSESTSKTTGKENTTANNEGSSSSEEQIVLKIGSVNSDKHTLYQGYKKFQEIVQSETNGKIKVEIYHSGQLGDDRTMIEGLQFGTLEAVGVSTSMLGNWAPPMLAYDLPFAFPDEIVADQVLDGPFGQKVAKLLEKEGLLLLAYMENGFRNLTNSSHEVTTVEDVEGLKIRTMQTPLHLATWKALGANPTPMAYTELFTAMQQGVVDGQENPFGNIVADKFYEVQKYLTITNHVYNPMGFVVAKKFFENLSEEHQEIVANAAVTAAKYQRELNRSNNEEYKKILKDNGMKITKLSPEAYQGFVDKVQVVYEEYSSTIGEDYLEEFLAEVKKYSK